MFAAGADIKAMVERTFQEVLEASTMPFWQRVADCRTPLIAAVSGFALGGGCELALLCDMIVASETAEFGQPEITLGIIPGGGGTQRLARVIGKQRTMEMVLTGRRIDAKEGVRLGFVNMVTPKKNWFSDALELAAVIARRPPLAVKLAKQAVLAADEMTLTAGLAHERRLYELAMATEDRVEGMQAFLEKRRPEFRGTVKRTSTEVAASASSAPARWAPASPRSRRLAGYETVPARSVAEALERGLESMRAGLEKGVRARPLDAPATPSWPLQRAARASTASRTSPIATS